MTVRKRYLARLLAGVLLVALLALLVACGTADPQNTFAPTGEVARKQRDLLNLVLVPAIVIFVVVEGLLVFAVIRFRHKRGEDVPAQVHGNTRLEIAWTIVPTLLLLGIAVPMVMTIVDLGRESPPDALQVNVIAHQWWWEFEYPEQPGITQAFVTANEMHIPVGRTVHVRLQSDDVIHSFWVPKLAGKTDVIPQRVNAAWFNATEPGNYSGQCAEFCGLSHALMRFRVIAEEPDRFDAWVKAQVTPAVQPTSGDALRGAEFFAANACSACHRVAGVSQGGVGPDLTTVASRGTIASGLLPNTAGNFARWLHDPQAVKPGAKMPVCAATVQRADCGLRLSEQDIADLVAYLQSLK